MDSVFNENHLKWHWGEREQTAKSLKRKENGKIVSHR